MPIPYTPKLPPAEVNVTRRHPLAEFARLLVGLAVILVIVYLALGIIAAILAPRIPASFERRLGALYTSSLETRDDTPEAERCARVLARLTPCLADQDRRLDYRVVVLDDEQINAVAMPGGTIAVYQGLLDEVRDDQELAFVLGHELGHFHHRDHLTGLGRALSLLAITTVISSGGNTASDFVSRHLFTLEMQFSREQERAADLYGLGLLEAAYGSGEGAVAFMERLQRQETRSRLAYYFASHPHPRERLQTIREAATP